MTNNPSHPAGANGPLVLITRPEPRGAAFLDALRGATNAPFRPILSPLMRIVTVGNLPDMTDVRGIVLTSAHGVWAYRHHGGPTDRPAHVVGPSTRDAALDLGMPVMSCDPNASALVARLSAQKPAAPLLHVRGTHSRGDIANRLTQAGIPTQDSVAYDQPVVPPTPEAQTVLLGDAPVIVPLFSPRSAKILADLPISAPLSLIALSSAVAKAAEPLQPTELRVASAPDAASILDATCALIDSRRTLEA